MKFSESLTKFLIDNKYQINTDESQFKQKNSDGCQPLILAILNERHDLALEIIALIKDFKTDADDFGIIVATLIASREHDLELTCQLLDLQITTGLGPANFDQYLENKKKYSALYYKALLHFLVLTNKEVKEEIPYTLSEKEEGYFFQYWAKIIYFATLSDNSQFFMGLKNRVMFNLAYLKDISMEQSAVKTPLFAAVDKEHIDIIPDFFKIPAWVKKWSRNRQTVFAYAAENQKWKALDVLLSKAIPFCSLKKEHDEYDLSLTLFWAIYFNKVDFVKRIAMLSFAPRFLVSGMQDTKGYSNLSLAVSHEQIDIIQDLVQLGCTAYTSSLVKCSDISVKDAIKKNTPFAIALQKRNKEILRCIFKDDEPLDEVLEWMRSSLDALKDTLIKACSDKYYKGQAMYFSDDQCKKFETFLVHNLIKNDTFLDGFLFADERLRKIDLSKCSKLISYLVGNVLKKKESSWVVFDSNEIIIKDETPIVQNELNDMLTMKTEHEQNLEPVLTFEDNEAFTNSEHVTLRRRKN